MDETWDHLLQISRTLTSEYDDAVFIGGVAVSCHASRLGSQYQESSHDADLYLSFVGKAAMRDRYEVRRNPHLNKDSVLIEGEDLDLYVERQHSLSIQYPDIFAFSAMVEGIRVAALEHLLVLKLDAARSRWGTGKGDKDVRDLARIVALLDHPRIDLLTPHLNPERMEMLGRSMGRHDLPQLLGFNQHEGSRFRVRLNKNLSEITKCAPAISKAPPEDPPSPPPKSPKARGAR